MYYKTAAACVAENLVQVDMLVHGACYSPDSSSAFAPKCTVGNAFRTEQVLLPLAPSLPSNHLPLRIQLLCSPSTECFCDTFTLQRTVCSPVQVNPKPLTLTVCKP